MKSVQEAYAEYKAWKKSLKGMTKEERKAEKAGMKARKAAEKEAIRSMSPEDAKAAKSFNRKYTLWKWKVPIAIVLVVAIALGAVGNYVWRNYRSTILAYLGITTQGVSLADVDEETLAEVVSYAQEVVEELEGEGAVLMQNDDDVLPLSDTKVNIFGIRAYDSLYTGGGSSGVKRDDDVTLQAALDSVGVEYNETLWNLYVNWYNDGTISTDAVDAMKESESSSNELDILLGSSSVEELPAEALTDDIIAEAVEYSDTAIIVIGRAGTEGSDLDLEDCYLYEDEEAMIDTVCANFENVIVLLNTGCYMDVSWIADREEIQSVLYIGLPGNTGYNAVAKILTGEINPSGRTADTWAYDITDQPSAVMTTTEEWQIVGEDGGYEYSNIDGQFFSYYYEGIYVGYRYYETRYMDDEETYQEKVVYPFGYGLSYTEFEWETTDYTADDETISVTVKVTNVGDVAGKDVVELYYSAPYYEDRGIEKSDMNLCAYAKTDTLEPGESQELTLTFDVTDMKSYDYITEKTYVMDEGDYEIRICRNSHDVVDTVVYTLEERLILNESEYTGEEITNQFDDVTYDAEITYLSRSDWEGTWPDLSELSYEASDTIVEKYEATMADYDPGEDSDEVTVWDEDAGLTLEDMVGVDYDDELWDTFVNQLSEDEAYELVGYGQYHTLEMEEYGIPYTAAADGPVGLTSLYSGDSGVDYCSSVVIAGTWNDELAAKMGDAIGKEATAYGITCWYGPGFDTHRSAVGGRNYEYYSEDGYLAGMIGANVVKAAQEQGVTCVVKHFALNDQDNNRDNGIMTFANEQAIREIYLKPFEIAMTEGEAGGVMIAMMRFGTDWAPCNEALVSTVIRDEWGYEGYTITDFCGMTVWEYSNFAKAILAGTDILLSTESADDFTATLQKVADVPNRWAAALHSSAKNILYMVANSSAMYTEAHSGKDREDTTDMSDFDVSSFEASDTEEDAEETVTEEADAYGETDEEAESGADSVEEEDSSDEAAEEENAEAEEEPADAA